MTTATASDTLTSLNPFDGRAVGSVPVTPAAHVETVIARARAAQPTWAAYSVEQRRDMILPLREALESQRDEIIELITCEMGRPLRESTSEFNAVVGMEAELDSMVAALQPEVIEDEDTHSTIMRDPLGVCAAITPWNFPLLMPHWMVLPALMAGNAVVLKPSDQTPLVAQRYADALAPLLPDGLLQVIHGGDEPGKALVAGDVDLIAFTGSRDAGRAIMAAASSGLKRLVLELGSKDPLIVLEDADLDAAAEFAAHNSYRNCGQVCVSTERIYVNEKVADEFMAKLLQHTADTRVGSGLDDATTVGPMVNATQRDHVVAQIQDAKAKGAKVLAGGEAGEGSFLSPTVLANVTHDMDIARIETFGPVACVMTVKDDDEAVTKANDSDLGLGGVIFGDEEHALRLAPQLRVGMLGINKSVGGAHGTPWVGARQSGYGYHSSAEGHRHFAQTRVINRAK